MYEEVKCIDRQCTRKQCAERKMKIGTKLNLMLETWFVSFRIGRFTGRYPSPGRYKWWMKIDNWFFSTMYLLKIIEISALQHHHHHFDAWHEAVHRFGVFCNKSKFNENSTFQLSTSNHKTLSSTLKTIFIVKWFGWMLLLPFLIYGKFKVFNNRVTHVPKISVISFDPDHRQIGSHLWLGCMCIVCQSLNHLFQHGMHLQRKFITSFQIPVKCMILIPYLRLLKPLDF